MWEECPEGALPVNHTEAWSRVEAFVGMWLRLTAQAASGEQFRSFNKYLSSSSQMRDLAPGSGYEA